MLQVPKYTVDKVLTLTDLSVSVRVSIEPDEVKSQVIDVFGPGSKCLCNGNAMYDWASGPKLLRFLLYFLYLGWQSSELPWRDHPGHPDGPDQAAGAAQPDPGHHAAVQDRSHQARVQGPELLGLPGQISTAVKMRKVPISF